MFILAYLWVNVNTIIEGVFFLNFVEFGLVGSRWIMHNYTLNFLPKNLWFSISGVHFAIFIIIDSITELLSEEPVRTNRLFVMI